MRKSRRKFMKHNLVASIGLTTIGSSAASTFLHYTPHSKNVPAILGGEAVFSNNAPKWQKWPIWNSKEDEPGVLEVLRSGVWSRSKVVSQFEEKWSALMGSKRCLTTVNGTNALICSLANLNVGGGDEVIVPPYTFIATPQAVLQTGAIPVFVDTDPDTFQMDVRKIEEKITPRTKAILPVHIAGLPSDMVNIMKIAKRHNLVIVEDACQAWMTEIDHKKVGTFGDAGCFSFQNSKNIPIGEGGAIISDNDEFMDQCFSYHNYGVSYGSLVEKHGNGFVALGTKLRMTEYQAAIGLAQLKRFVKQTDTRYENGLYLKSRLEKIPGIIPFKLYDNVTKVSFHIFPFRYKKEEFKGLSRSEFLQALRAEGVPATTGYRPLNQEPFISNAFKSKNFKRMYSEKTLDYEEYMERNACPNNDIICNEEAVWILQNILLGNRTEMDYIVQAIEKIYDNAEKIKNSLK